MRIALIAFHFAEYVYRLARALAEQHQVLLLLDRANAADELGAEALKSTPRLRIEQYPNYGLKNPRFLCNTWRITRAVRRFTPDVVHFQEAPRDYLVAALPWLRRYPWVLTIHDHTPHSGRDTHDRRRIVFYRDVMRRQADAVIVHGERIRQELGSLLPWVVTHSFAIPHGVLGGAASSTSRPWEPGRLLFFGRIEQYKGLACLVDAVAILQSKGVSVKVVIAGTGEDLDRHRERIAGNPMFELREGYIPHVEIPELFARANAVVLPYTDATQSGVAAMAMQFARPVIASDVGSIGEVVSHGANGLLVPPRNAEALAQAIETLVGDSILSAHLSEGARRTAREQLSWTAIAHKTVQVYAVALNRGLQT